MPNAFAVQCSGVVRSQGGVFRATNKRMPTVVYTVRVHNVVRVETRVCVCLNVAGGRIVVVGEGSDERFFLLYYRCPPSRARVAYRMYRTHDEKHYIYRRFLTHTMLGPSVFEPCGRDTGPRPEKYYNFIRFCFVH